MVVSIMRRLGREDIGATMVEMSISIVLLLILTLGFVDFGYAFYQWNAASKAVQVGARLASISPPVAKEAKDAGPTAIPGDPVAVNSYSYLCDGLTSSCSCTGAGCTATATWWPRHFERIYYGDDDQCGAPLSGRPGMCDFFGQIQRENIEIRYAATGLGYQTRPGGAVPTITVRLKNLNYQFFFLGGLLSLDAVPMPSMLSTVTGEDLEDGEGPP